MATWSNGMVAANGANIHYYRTGGSGPKRAMLLLHGITDNGLCWQRIAADLADRYDIVMADARGHGASDRVAEDYSVPLLAADAAGVIRGLALERPVVFGHSMGAITAAALAAEYPELVSAIILEDPPLRGEPAAPLPAEFIANWHKSFMALRELSVADRAAQCAAENPGWHTLELGPWAQSKAEVDPAVLKQIGRFDAYSWRDALKRIQCPGLLIIGDAGKNAIVTAQVAAEAVELWQSGEVAHIQGAGHCIHRDRYAETLAAINAFLQKQG